MRDVSTARRAAHWAHLLLTARSLGLALLAGLALGLPATTAQARPIALDRSDAPGAKRATTSTAQLRATLAASMRGGPRAAVRRSPSASSALTIGQARLLTGSVELPSESAAKAVERAARSSTTIGKRQSTALVVVRAGAAVGLIRLQVKGRDRAIRATADQYAALLKARLVVAQRTVADRLADDGESTKAEALALFQLAYGGMPGAKVPAGRRGTLSSATVASSRVLRILDQLTPAQRRAFTRATDSPSPAAAAARAPADPRARRLALTPDPVNEALAASYVATYASGSFLGRALPFPVKVFRTDFSINALADAWPVNAAGSLEKTAPASCRVRLDPSFYAKPVSAQQYVIAHEVFHCFEFSMTENWGTKSRDWVIEGMADWAASQVTNDTTGEGSGSYLVYLGTPETRLFSRGYSASGFWGHLNERLGSLWPRVVGILRTVGEPETYDYAGGSSDAARLTAASRLLREPAAGSAWITAQPYLLSPAEAPTPRAVSSANAAAIAVGAYANKLIDLRPSATHPVLELQRGRGNLRVTDGGLGEWVDPAKTFICFGATCQCAEGETSSLPAPLPNATRLTAALAGEKTGGRLFVIRHRLKEYCRKDGGPKSPPKTGGATGAGGSNGDPHLSSHDGLRFDFQAAGEFVLTRAGDDLEIQARQEPWKLGTTVIRSVTINTQFAVRIGSGRATFSPGSGQPSVRVGGGASQVLAAGGSLTVGAGRITSDGEQLTATWPDGSQAVVWPVGAWGLAISIQLAAGRAGQARGLLGDFDNNALDDLQTRGGKSVAFKAEQALWPGLNRVRFADPTDPGFADRLYDTFGDSWRISQRESLLDYAKGQSTKTFTDQSIPRKLVEADDLSDGKRQQAEATCRAAGVTAPAALEDCILDVALTGQAAFAESAAREEALVATTWTRLAAGAARSGPVSLARTGDGTLHLVWPERDAGGKRSVVAGGIGADGRERAPVAVAPFDTTPYAFTAPDGGLRIVGSVLDSGPPVTEGIAQFGSAAPFASWSSLPMIVSPGAYVGEPSATYVGSTLLTVSPLAGNGRLYTGTGTGSGGGELLNGALAADCYAQKPAIASSGGETYAAWWQWDCPQTGLFVASVDPATGKLGAPTPVPQSTWTLGSGAAISWDAPGLDRLSLAARPGGGLFLAYARQEGDTWTALLWRIGSAAPQVIASGLRERPDSLQVSAEPTTGVLWVAWETQDASFGKGRLAVRRTTPAGDAWAGAARQIAFPSDGDERASSVHPWDVLARDGALDVIAGYTASGDYPGALWRTSLAP